MACTSNLQGPVLGPDSIAAAWAERAPELAAWVDDHLVNRRDAFGHYIAREDRRDPDLTAYTDKSSPTRAILAQHFRGQSTGNLIGLHSTARNDDGTCWSRWGAIDIDRHDEAIDPETTRRAAAAWYERAR